MRSLILTLCLLLGSSAAIACSCLPPPPPLEAAANADAVFVGTPVSKIDDQDNWRRIYTFEVSGSWKGVTTKTVVVTTPWDEAMCGLTLSLGADYVVYAWNYSGALETYLCSRTNPVLSAADDLAALGSPTIVANERLSLSVVKGRY